MVNGSGTKVPMPTRKQRRKRYRDLGERSAGGDSRQDSCEEMEPNKHAASIIQRKELEEIVSLFGTTLGRQPPSLTRSVARRSHPRQTPALRNFHNEPLRRLSILLGEVTRSPARCGSLCGETYGMWPCTAHIHSGRATSQPNTTGRPALALEQSKFRRVCN